MSQNQLSLLKTRRFLPLFVTQFFGAFNDNVFKNALVILITYRLADSVSISPQILVTLAAGIFILPFFLFSAMAGQLADKYEKAYLISVIKLIEILIMLVAAIGFYTESVALLMLVLFSLGTHASFFGPLKYSILPNQLQESELIAGNGLIEAGTFLAILLGTIIGGVSILNPVGEFIITVLILGVALVGFLASLAIPKTTWHNPNIIIRYNIFKETWALISYSKQRKDLFLCILGISWFWLVGAAFLAEFPVFAKDALNSNQHVVTYFLTLFSVGLGIGSLLCNRLLKGKVHATYVPLAALGMSVFMIDLFFAASHPPHHTELAGLLTFLSHGSGWRISIDLILIAICGGIYTVPLYALLQARSGKEHCARVIASNNVVNALFMVISAIAIVLMFKLHLTITQIFLTIAILNLFVAFYICNLLPQFIVKSIFRWILNLFYRVEVRGIENYRAAGDRVVIIANHTSFLDAVLLATYLEDTLTFAINTTTAKKWWIRIFLSLVEAYPLDPTNPMALKSLIEWVRQDKRCVIFPEGRLTVTGALMKIYEGPGLIADKSLSPLLPVRIDGAQLTPFSRLKGKIRLHWFPKITITIFPPEVIQLPNELKGRFRRQTIGMHLYDVMTKLMFESSNYHVTLFSSLIDACKTHGRRHEIMEDITREPMNYQTFMVKCFILANILAKKTERQEAVGVLLPNMMSTVLTFFALQAIHRIPAMLNYSAGPLNILTACLTAKIKTVYTSEKFIKLAKLNGVIERLKTHDIRIEYLEDIVSKVSLFDKLKGFLAAQFKDLTYANMNKAGVSAENPAVILFTSGSEGTPKAVVLSHVNIQANRFQLSACVDFTGSDKVFNALPIFHSFGLTGGTLLPILSGMKVFFYPSPLHYRIVPILSYDTNATIFFGTDTFLAGYAKYAHPYDFYSVRYVFAGAEKLREETRQLWSQKFGVRIFEGYGATETSPVLATNTPMQNKVGTVGRFLPGIQYELKPIAGIPEGGVLHVKGPNVMKGYYLSEKPGFLVPPPSGWYDTGDVVTVDKGGFVRIEGRVKRFAKLAGEMVSLTMVEQKISRLWPEAAHAALALPDSKKGEQIILATTHTTGTREEIIMFFKQNGVTELAIPKKIIVLDDLPLLGTGKVDYVSLKKIIDTTS